MSNGSKNEEAKLTSSRELTAEELNQVTAGLGPILIFRQLPSTLGPGITGESTDKPHTDWVMGA